MAHIYIQRYQVFGLAMHRCRCLWYAVHNGQQIATFIESFKYKDLEVVLRKQFSEAKELSDSIRISSKLLPDESNREVNDDLLINQLATIDPSAAILKIWQGLEARIIRCIQYNGLIRFTNPMNFMKQLSKNNKLTDAELKLFNRLRTIRNEAVHGPVYGQLVKVSFAEVVEYQELAETLVRRIDAITRDAGQGNYVGLDDIPPHEL